MAKLSEKPNVTAFDSSQSYFHVLRSYEPAPADQDNRVQLNVGILDELSTTRLISVVSAAGNAIDLDLKGRIESAISTTLDQDISPGGINISNLITGRFLANRLTWRITATGAPRSVPASAFPAGTLIDTDWEPTINVGELRVAVLESWDDGFSFRLTSNSSTTPFLGPGTTGPVPDPLTSSGRALLDDGTWGTPTAALVTTSVSSASSDTIADTDHLNYKFYDSGGFVTINIPDSLPIGFLCRFGTIGSTALNFVSPSTTLHGAGSLLQSDGSVIELIKYAALDAAVSGNVVGS